MSETATKSRIPPRGGSGTAPPKVPAEPWPTEKSLGDWTRALWQERVAYLRDRYQTKAAMSGSTGLTGGYLVPVEFVKGILATAHEESFFLQNALKVPLTSAETLVPHVRVNAGAAGITPFFGGFQAFWGTEGAALTQSEPTFSSVTMRAHVLQAYSVISNQMLQDADDNEMSTYLKQILGEAAAWYFDFACFSGDGAGKPLGVINAPGRLVVTGGPLSAAKVAEMASKMLPGSWETAVWAMHPNAYESLVAVAPYQLNPAGLAQSLLHRPIVLTEKLSGAGVVLFDPALYLVGLRQDIEVSVSKDEPTLYLRNQSVLRMVCRGDGQPRLQTSVTLADGTETASAYVVLTA